MLSEQLQDLSWLVDLDLSPVQESSVITEHKRIRNQITVTGITLAIRLFVKGVCKPC